MKPFIYCIAAGVLLVLATLSNRSEALPGKEPATLPVSVGEFLYTVTLHKQIDPATVALELNHEFIDPGMNDSIIVPLFELIKANKLNCYRPAYPFTEKLTNEEAANTIAWMDSVPMEDPYTFDLTMVPVNVEIFPQQIVSITFHEEWFYDAVKLSLQKRVKGIIPNAETNDGYGPVVHPLFYVPVTTAIMGKAMNELYDFTSDFHADGFERINYPRKQTIVRDSLLAIKQKSFQDTLIVRLTRHAGEKKTDIRVHPFPYTTPITKEERLSVQQEVKKTNTMRFRENWKVDMRNQVFVKEVTALMPGTEIALTEEGQNAPSVWIDNFHYLFPVNGFVPGTHSGDITTVEHISYGVTFRDSDDRLYPKLSAENPLGIVSAVNEICNKVQDGAYYTWVSRDGSPVDPWRMNSATLLTKEEAQGLFRKRDSVFVEDFELGHWETREYVFPADRYCGLKFFERWTYERTANRFTKVVRAYGVNRLEESNYGERLDIRTPFMCMSPGLQPESEIMQPEFQIAADVSMPVLINANEFYPEDGDFMRLKYSYYDSHDQNIYPALRYELVQPVIADVLAGKLIAYAPDTGNGVISPGEFRALLERFDNKAGNSIAGLEYRWFNELIFLEDWFFRPETGQFCKRVREITFVHRYADNWDQEIYGQRVAEPVFRIKLRP